MNRGKREGKLRFAVEAWATGYVRFPLFLYPDMSNRARPGASPGDQPQ
jgi:hypothetical protein